MALPPNYSYRADADQSAFVERALLYVETEAYNTEFPPLEGMMYVPVDTSTPEGAKWTAYRQYTRTGLARLVTGRGKDLPTSRVFVKEYFHPFYRIGSSYEYTLDDLLASQFASSNSAGPAINLDLELALGARTAIDRGLDVVCALGSATDSDIPGLSEGIGSDVGMLGLLNQPNATTYTPATGAAGQTEWDTKTPDEVIADLSGQYAALVSGTYKVARADQVLMPINQFEQLNTKRMGDGSDETVISFFKKVKPGVGVDSWQYCEGAGTDGADRCVMYMNNRRYVRHMISQMFRQEPPQFRDMTFRVACTAKTAGVISPYPFTISYADGI